MTSVPALKTVIKLTGPDAMPWVDLTMSPAGRSFEKLKPTPPPLCSMIAMFFTAVKMLSRESSTGRT
jgi:hypothetical protein